MVTDVAQVRIMFEVQDLRYATLATVSRCGMVWFSEDVLSVEMMFENFMQRLRNVPVEDGEEEVTARARRSKVTSGSAADEEEDLPPSLHVCIVFTTMLFTFIALTLLVWRQEAHLACKKLGVGLMMVMI